MQCRMVEMRYKEVINICDGCRLGFVGDVEVLLPEGRVTALIVAGTLPLFSACSAGGRSFSVPWECNQADRGRHHPHRTSRRERRPPYQERRRKRRLF